jgi:hypothetical protein
MLRDLQRAPVRFYSMLREVTGAQICEAFLAFWVEKRSSPR